MAEQKEHGAVKFAHDFVMISLAKSRHIFG